MGFDSRQNAKAASLREGDRLDDIAAREQAAGNDITAEQIAKFNWGTEDEAEINEFMRDELGARKRDDKKNFVVAADDTRRSQLLVPKKFEKPGLATGRTHTLRVVAKSAPPQFLECCSIPGVTFEFDKSFVRPAVVDTLKQLEAAMGRNPDAKIMIWGHTDKVGSEQYNKLLSERRAKSVFAFITNDVDTWEQLFNQESWGSSATNQMLADQGFDPATNPNAVRDYQTARGLNPDGAVGPLTRKQLFTDYMSGKHDLKLTADQFMDPKHMGCGEFNPQVPTEAANETNRRVTFFLFHKDRLPKLPCPTAPGDVAPCKKQQVSLDKRHVPSFTCSFFDSIAFKCVCENPKPVPIPATIEILDKDLNVATAVKFGLWDNAFDAAGATLNDVVEANNFCGADTRRFHFRVRDPAAAGPNVEIDWRTLTNVRTNLDTAAAPNLTLVETPAGSKTFLSRGLLITTDNDDVKALTNTGLTAPASEVGNRGQGAKNHRTRSGSMLGFVKGEYRPAGGGAAVSVELPVFDRSPDERRRMPVQFFVMRVAAGGAGVVATAPGSTLWTRDIRVIRESWERIGLQMETLVAPGTPAGDIVTDSGLSIVLITVPAGINPLNVTLANETTIGGAFPAVGHTLRVFVAGRLASGNRGEAAPDVDFAGTPDQGTAFVNGATMGPYTIAHEMGHILTDKSNALSGGHYRPPAAPAGNRFHNNQNLMRNATSGAEAVGESKRIWDVADADGNNAFTRSRGSPYTRAF